MSELRIIRGRDIDVFINNRPAFGITELSVRKKRGYHDVYEFLSSEPVERIAQGTGYEVKLKMMSMFDSQIPSDESFSISVIEDEVEYSVGGCIVTDVCSKVNGGANAVQSYMIEALSFTERVIEDEE